MGAVSPSKAGSEGERDALGDSVGFAAEREGVSIAAAPEATGSEEVTGTTEAADVNSDEADTFASSCTAPEDTAELDEHPAMAEVKSTSPMVRF